MKIFLKQHKYAFIIFFIAATFLTICSKNSPLYLINDWYDAEAFMTMGKGLMNGLIPYKDLFEQKGPILYFIYYLANLISSKSFIGVYLIEIISFSIFLYYVKKTINLFYDNTHVTISLILLSFGIIMLRPFGHGGSAEELCLPFFMYSIYSHFKFLHTGKTTKKEIFINGLMAGIILWIKYTLLGFHFILAATYFFVYIYEKKYKDAIYACLIFLSGMFAITIPVLTFFIINDGLKDLFNVYFIINMTSYSKISSPLIKIQKAITLLGNNLITNPSFILFIVIPLLYYAKKNLDLKIKGSKWIIAISLIFMGLGTFIGGTNYFYYSFVITPFMILGVLLINELLTTYNIKFNYLKMCSITIFLFTVIIMFSPNIQYLSYKREDYAQFVFADIINKSDDKSLINYDFLDGGFYLTTNEIPHCYYFMRNNLPYENYSIMYKTQKEYIVNEKPHYVITVKKFKFLAEENYQIIKSMRQKYEDNYVVYYLYAKDGL